MIYSRFLFYILSTLITTTGEVAGRGSRANHPHLPPQNNQENYYNFRPKTSGRNPQPQQPPSRQPIHQSSQGECQCQPIVKCSSSSVSNI